MKPTALEEWRGQHVVVLGLAKSGVAVAKLLHRLGVRVTVNDRKPRSESPEAEELEKRGIPVICGGHPDDLIGPGVDRVVKNPGIPYHAPPIKRALELGIPVMTEVEVAYLVTEAPIIGITGSNGKTTTTSLVGRMLSTGDISSHVAGNIGQALADVAPELKPDQWLVAELSSFQLKGTVRFRPRIGALLNVTPAHLDYHGGMDDYIASKSRLFANQQKQDTAVLNWDSPVCRRIGEKRKGRVVWFSRREEVPQGWHIRDGMIVQRKDGTEKAVMPVSKVRLPGVHVENGLAAAAIASAAGCSMTAIAHELASFTGVEHRLEFVTEKDGVRWYNDSKATNPQAATAALESFPSGVVLIAGGLDRGIDFHELTPVFRDRLKGLVTFGQTADILLRRAQEAQVVHRRQASGVREAVRLAADMAEPGDIVLLSPACASWDQHASFEERGSIFKEAVHSL
ncbi:UDP-N-acetylmuramoyl-L-alanine--D-glutamate ligase [Desmospora profundinema]|uniref:UDP-N-acetylmuramoylalanine--D-glutamate ligase n=1 Tax=Desmospora profundinema TaxID=1571184 RepID=A0ABU1IJ69_9BACL|nr:UDP-N-acetylmuramoyl-L-alanine--D-glutamate ligase [Desmospora profundinema]MDR6224801.1 UDP-N-acetylmuramoylalanine--D-glutamate ligase [Desmospora profundinema]